MRRRTTPFTLLTFAITGAFLALFLVWPVGEAVAGAFFDPAGKFTLGYLAEVLRNPIYLEGLRNALAMGLGSTALAFGIALPLAAIEDRFEFPGKRWLTGLILVPMVLPPFVGAIGIRAIFGQMGAANALLHAAGLLPARETIDWLGQHRFAGILALNALHLYPILYLNLAAAFAHLDPALEEAAENLGCTGWRKFRRVTLPLLAPGVFGGGSIVFIWAFTELGTPLVFGFNRITPVQIFTGLREVGGNALPFALVAITLAAALATYGGARWLLGRFPEPGGRTPAGKRARKAGRIAAVLCPAAFIAVSALALLPHAAVIVLSFARDWYGTILPEQWTLAHYAAALGHALTIPSIGNSIKYAGLATLLDLGFGAAIAWVLVRRPGPASAALDALAMLPLAVPGLVLAFGYIALSQPGRPLAGFNPSLHSPLLLLVAAYAIRRLPYVVRSVAAGLQQTSTALEEAAQSLGATPWRSLRRITLPLIGANVVAGVLLAFAFAMLEVSDSLILAQRAGDYPITKAIYELFQLLGEGPYIACALGVWAMLFLTLTILTAARIVGARLGAVFRL